MTAQTAEFCIVFQGCLGDLNDEHLLRLTHHRRAYILDSVSKQDYPPGVAMRTNINK